GRHGRRQRSADDPAEEAAASAAKDAAFEITHQVVDDLRRRRAVLGERTIEARAQLIERHGGAHAPVHGARKVVQRMAKRAFEGAGIVLFGGHAGHLTACGWRSSRDLAWRCTGAYAWRDAYLPIEL